MRFVSLAAPPHHFVVTDLCVVNICVCAPCYTSLFPIVRCVSSKAANQQFLMRKKQPAAGERQSRNDDVRQRSQEACLESIDRLEGIELGHSTELLDFESHLLIGFEGLD